MLPERSIRKHWSESLLALRPLCCINISAPKHRELPCALFSGWFNRALEVTKRLGAPGFKKLGDLQLRVRPRLRLLPCMEWQKASSRFSSRCYLDVPPPNLQPGIVVFITFGDIWQAVWKKCCMPLQWRQPHASRCREPRGLESASAPHSWRPKRPGQVQGSTRLDTAQVKSIAWPCLLNIADCFTVLV